MIINCRCISINYLLCVLTFSTTTTLTRPHTRTHRHTQARTHTHTHTHTHARSTYIRTQKHIHAETCTHTDTHTRTQTHTHQHRHTYTHTHKQVISENEPHSFVTPFASPVNFGRDTPIIKPHPFSLRGMNHQLSTGSGSEVESFESGGNRSMAATLGSRSPRKSSSLSR